MSRMLKPRRVGAVTSGPLYPGLPVILTSGYSHVLAQEGPHGFELLHKPYAAKEVSRMLRQVMQGREHKEGR
jgi:hypothetical protein